MRQLAGRTKFFNSKQRPRQAQSCLDCTESSSQVAAIWQEERAHHRTGWQVNPYVLWQRRFLSQCDPATQSRATVPVSKKQVGSLCQVSFQGQVRVTLRPRVLTKLIFLCPRGKRTIVRPWRSTRPFRHGGDFCYMPSEDLWSVTLCCECEQTRNFRCVFNTCVRVVPAHTGTCRTYTRGRVEWTHGFSACHTPHRTHTTTQDTTYHSTPQQHDNRDRERDRDRDRDRQRQRREEKREERKEKREDSFSVWWCIHVKRVNARFLTLLNSVKYDLSLISFSALW